MRFAIFGIRHKQFELDYQEALAETFATAGEFLLGMEKKKGAAAVGWKTQSHDATTLADLDPVPVTITAGRRVSCVGGVWRVPKRVLVTALVSAMEGGRLKVSRSLPGAEALARELAAFQVRITSHQHAAFNGVGEHDDLVLSVALAVWWASQPATSCHQRFPVETRRRASL